MKKIINHARIPAPRTTSLLLLVLLLFSTGCDKIFDEIDDYFHKKPSGPKYLKDFYQVNLVGSNQEYNPGRTDPNLVNAWGIAFSATGTPWINSTGKGLSLIYNAEGGEVRAPVAVPSPTETTGGLPTGIVFNGGTDF